MMRRGLHPTRRCHSFHLALLPQWLPSVFSLPPRLLPQLPCRSAGRTWCSDDDHHRSLLLLLPILLLLSEEHWETALDRIKISKDSDPVHLMTLKFLRQVHKVCKTVSAKPMDADNSRAPHSYIDSYSINS